MEIRIKTRYNNESVSRMIERFRNVVRDAIDTQVEHLRELEETVKEMFDELEEKIEEEEEEEEEKIDEIKSKLTEKKTELKDLTELTTELVNALKKLELTEEIEGLVEEFEGMT